MARIAGRNGRLYVGISSAGTAEPIAFLSQFTASWTTEKYDVTAFGDSNKSYVAGLPDFQATYTGFYDTATAQLYTAATDGVARKFYMYTDTTLGATNYWFGTAFFDFNIDESVAGPVAISGTFAAATATAKIP